MATRHVGLRDVAQGKRPSRLRLLAPLRYLTIYNEEKAKYDVLVPILFGSSAWILYIVLSPHIRLFGDAGLFTFARDFLVMAVPFLFGSLAAVAMGAPGAFFDKRPLGVNLNLDGRPLTLRQFVCYLLGYLTFIGLFILVIVVVAMLIRPVVLEYRTEVPVLISIFHYAGSLIFFNLMSVFAVTILWALYFLTDVVNCAGRDE